jgi:hypothetical protein
MFYFHRPLCGAAVALVFFVFRAGLVSFHAWSRYRCAQLGYIFYFH